MNNRLLHDLLDDRLVWANFFNVLQSKKINPKSLPYYKNHVKQFLSKAQNTTVEKLTATRACNYLNSSNKNSSLEDWQFNQSIDAIHLFLRDVLHIQDTDKVDWQSYKQDVIYKTKHNMVLMEDLDIPELIAKTVNQFEQKLRDHYSDLLTKIVRVLRVRNYSRRTEHTRIN